ncbi:MAG: hypothetical protein WC763_02255 [Candidatus Paceibacterota bacterium]|jgi:hypothetical protein
MLQTARIPEFVIIPDIGRLHYEGKKDRLGERRLFLRLEVALPKALIDAAHRDGGVEPSSMDLESCLEELLREFYGEGSSCDFFSPGPLSVYRGAFIVVPFQLNESIPRHIDFVKASILLVVQRLVQEEERGY